MGFSPNNNEITLLYYKKYENKSLHPGGIQQPLRHSDVHGLTIQKGDTNQWITDL